MLFGVWFEWEPDESSDAPWRRESGGQWMTDHKTARGPALFHCAHDANEAAANERVNRYNAERFSRIVARPYRVEIPPCLIFEGKGCT